MDYDVVVHEETELIKVIDSLYARRNVLDNQRVSMKNEMNRIQSQLDALIPPPPIGPQPKHRVVEEFLRESFQINGNYGLNINQLALSNWAAGGENSSTGKVFANIVITGKRTIVEHKLQGNFAFGISRFADKRIEKSDDKIDLQYTLSKRSSSQFNFSMVGTFNTQFADGYAYPNDSTRISGFFAPAYLTLSGGFTFKTKERPNTAFSIYLSPIAGKTTFVTIQELADLGSFGVEKAHYDADSIWIPGKNYVAALGANAIVSLSQQIGKNIKLTTALNGYYNYSEHRDDHRIKIDVNWETTLNFSINKHVNTILFVHLKYDHNTLFPVYANVDGTDIVVDNIPKLQFKESLGIAFTRTF